MLLQLPSWTWCTLGLALGTAPTGGSADLGYASGGSSKRLRSNSTWDAQPESFEQLFRQFKGDDLVNTEEVTPGLTKPQVSIEFYYLTTCPHCLTLIQRTVAPLVEAQLPGDEVQLTVLPVLKGMSNPQKCMETSACHHALAPLCALKGTMPQPSPADSPELRKAVEFMACDLRFTAAGLGNTPEAMQDCAGKASLDWEALDRCAKGQEVFDLMYGAAYAKTVVAAMHRLQKAGYAQPPSMPWVFLDGKLLTCGSEGCVAERAPSGDLALPRPGSLLALACAKLDSQPEACRNAQRPLDPTQVEAEARIAEQASECENCAEVGHFHWNVVAAYRAEQAPLLALSLLVVAAATGFLAGYHRMMLSHIGQSFLLTEGLPSCLVSRAET